MSGSLIKTAEAMEALGASLSQQVRAPAVVFLQGDLGAGKTTLVRGWLRALGVTGPVKSPTYTLVEAYALAQTTVFHFDFYRLTSPLELEGIGMRDYLTQAAICLIEWPERVQVALPKPDVVIQIEIDGDRRRVIISKGGAART